MEELFKIFALLSAVGVLGILSVVFSLLFMHYSARYRNQKLSSGWYICGVLFGFWTLIIFFIKRKDFPGPDIKVCYQCGDKFPDSFQICPKCLIGLPENNTEEKKKQQKLSRFFGIAIAVIYVLALVVGIIIGVTVSSSDFDDMSYNDVDDRISVDGVFYDKKGNSYEDEDSVLLYDKNGRIYTYTIEVSETDPLSEECYYVRDDGEKYFVYDCYVTEDGWFYCDKAMLLEMYTVDTSTMTEEELDEYYNDLIESDDYEYKYYDYPYVDAEGNFYYWAYEASWNEKGELITAENDVSAIS